MNKKTVQTFSVSFFLFVIFIQWIIKIPFWFKFVCLLIGLVNILGWVMDKYFVKKYGSEVLPFAKDNFGEVFNTPKGYIDQSPFASHRRKIKEWWSKLWAKK